MNITIRDVDENIFRRFKAEAVRDGIQLGKALTGAMKFWLKRKKPAKPQKSLLELRPFDWGKGTEKSSVEVDQILYCDSKSEGLSHYLTVW